MSSGSVSSGILSSSDDPRGRCTFEAAWLNSPIMSAIGPLARSAHVGAGAGTSVDQGGLIYARDGGAVLRRVNQSDCVSATLRTASTHGSRTCRTKKCGDKRCAVLLRTARWILCLRSRHDRSGRAPAPSSCSWRWSLCFYPLGDRVKNTADSK